MKSKYAITLIVLALLVLLAAACAAPGDAGPDQNPAVGPPPLEEGQVPPPPPEGGEPGQFGGPGGMGGFGQIISEATGLDMETMRQQGSEGATLAEMITDNGGDLEQVKAELVEAMSQMPDADQADIEQRVDEMLNNPFSMPGPGLGRGEGRGPRPEGGE